MTRGRRGDRCVLVRGVVSTIMVLAGEVPLHATLSMGGEGLLLRTGEFANPTSQDVALMSISGRGPMLSVGMVTVEYDGASARCSNEATKLKYFILGDHVV